MTPELPTRSFALPRADRRDNSTGGQRYLASLDGVRALAVLAVIGVHLNLPFAPGGGIGVIVFFVLSGFLITGLLIGERDRFGGIRLSFFYARRALRLLPALLLLILATTTVALTTRNTPLGRSTLHFTPAALFYYGNWVRAASPYFVGGTLAHTWSLSVEEQFYLCWPIVLITLFATGTRLRTIAIVAVAGALLSDAAKAVVWMGGSLNGDANRMYGTDLSGDALMVGCALAILIRTRPGLVTRIVRLGALPAAVYLLVVVSLIHPVGAGTTFAEARAFDVLAWPLVSVAAAFVIGYLALGPRVAASRLLGRWPLTYVGRISYGLYLWHYPVLIWMTIWFGFGITPSWWQVLVDLVLTLLVAAASYHIVERRMLSLKRLVRQATVDVSPSSALSATGRSAEV